VIPQDRRAVLDVLREALADSLGDKDLRKQITRCESATGVNGVLEIAAALEPFAFTVADLDPDPYLLNTAAGTLDLRTMQLRGHDPADRITKITRGSYDPAAGSPAWDRFLGRVLPDADLRGFLQRLAGVGLLGQVVERVLAMLTGTGANGKTTFTDAPVHALGDYARHLEPELFSHRDGAHPTGQMDLRGVRWAIVAETEQDRRLVVATVKRLTGGDMITARPMRQDFVSFKPSHTALMFTNHLPQVPGDDPALWRRIRVVPFDVVIPEPEQHKHLADRLHLEVDGILSWAVAGYQDWAARGGLDAPRGRHRGY
jgi:putative DNA primase/helicase